VEVRVRVGSRCDIPALVEVERSDTLPWSPWMDVEALSRHWDHIERVGIIPLVAELEGRVVGHLDVVLTEEPPLGSYLYLDVLVVHKAYRRRGVATMLIEEVERIARERAVDMLLVNPEDYEGPSGLTYRSMGFERMFEFHRVAMSCGDLKMPEGLSLNIIPRGWPAPLKTHEMVCRAPNVSVNMWDYAVNPLTYSRTDVLEYHWRDLALWFSSRGWVSYVCLNQSPRNLAEVSVETWVPAQLDEESLGETFSAVKALASMLKANTIATYAFGDRLDLLRRFGFEDRGKCEPWLAKRIASSDTPKRSQSRYSLSLRPGGPLERLTIASGYAGRDMGRGFTKRGLKNPRAALGKQ